MGRPRPRRRGCRREGCTPAGDAQASIITRQGNQNQHHHSQYHRHHQHHRRGSIGGEHTLPSKNNRSYLFIQECWLGMNTETIFRLCVPPRMLCAAPAPTFSKPAASSHRERCRDRPPTLHAHTTGLRLVGGSMQRQRQSQRACVWVWACERWSGCESERSELGYTSECAQAWCPPGLIENLAVRHVVRPAVHSRQG